MCILFTVLLNAISAARLWYRSADAMEIDQYQDPVVAKARSYFEKHKCNHEDCVIPNTLELAVSFAKMKDEVRINVV